ncbi:MAG: hypothetical protein AAF667_19425 [Pseudomonadota bacterium]
MKRFVSAFSVVALIATPALGALTSQQFDVLLAGVRASCSGGGENCTSRLSNTSAAVNNARTAATAEVTDFQLGQLIVALKEIVESADLPEGVIEGIAEVIEQEISADIEDAVAAEAARAIGASIAAGTSAQIDENVVAEAVSTSPG